jgi:hypothetical protein
LKIGFRRDDVVSYSVTPSTRADRIAKARTDNLPIKLIQAGANSRCAPKILAAKANRNTLYFHRNASRLGVIFTELSRPDGPHRIDP